MAYVVSSIGHLSQAARPKDLNQTWDELEQGLSGVIASPFEHQQPQTRTSITKFSHLYTLVYDYCATPWRPTKDASATAATSDPKGKGKEKADLDEEHATDDAIQKLNENDSLGQKIVGELLYKKLTEFLEKHLRILYQISDGINDGSSTIAFYTREWRRYQAVAKQFDRIFAYMNKNWIAQEQVRNQSLKTVHALAYHLWNKQFSMFLAHRLLPILIELIDAYRIDPDNGFDPHFIFESLQTFASSIYGFDEGNRSWWTSTELTNPTAMIALQVYQKHFEKPYIRHLKDYYITLACEHPLQDLQSMVDYVRLVVKVMKKEREFCKDFLHRSTGARITKAICKSMMTVKFAVILSKVPTLLANQVTEGTQMIYQLMQYSESYAEVLKLPKLSQLLEKFQDFVRLHFDAVLSNLAGGTKINPKRYIETLMNLYNYQMGVITFTFESNKIFADAFITLARSYVNRNLLTENQLYNLRSSQCLATYVDHIMRSNKIDETLFHDKLKQLMFIFQSLADKGEFIKLYTEQLAQRLVQSLSVSKAREESLIALLKNECDLPSLALLARMFSDFKESAKIQLEFRNATKKVPQPGLIFNLLLLSSAHWPVQSSKFSCFVSAEVTGMLETFSKYYVSKYPGRRLTWLTQFSRGDAVTNYIQTPISKPKQFVLRCSGFQMAILCCFNRCGTPLANIRTTSGNWSTGSDGLVQRFSEIRRYTNLPDEVLTSVIRTLVASRIIIATPQLPSHIAATIPNSHCFSLNQTFSSKRTRIDVNRILPKDAYVSSKALDRQLEIQASAVRIMKRMKKLDQAALSGLIIAQLQDRFRPEIKSIRMCLDVLVQKGYLTFEDKTHMYTYKE